MLWFGMKMSFEALLGSLLGGVKWGRWKLFVVLLL